jgi:PAS domain S-box-containing protein
MEWQTTPFVFPTLFGTVLAVVLFVYGVGYLRREGWRPSVGAFVVFNAAVTVWTAGAAVKLLALDPATKLLFYKILHVGAATVPPTWLVFALAFTDRSEWLRPSVLTAAYLVPATFLTLLFLEPGSLVIAGTSTVTTNGVTTLEVSSGPLHTLLGRAFNLVVVVFASGLIVQELFRRGRGYLPVALLVLAGTLVPLSVIGFETFDVPPVGGRGVNYVPVSAAISAGLLGIATFRYRILDLVPLAYRTVAESTPDGVVVVDAEGTVRNANTPARTLLGLDGDPTGRPAETVLPSFETITEHDRETGPLDIVIEGGDHDEPADRRVLEVRSRAVEHRGDTVGRTYVFRDITERRTYERSLETQNTQLQVVNQAVRHDIRNDMTLAAGSLRRALRQDVPPEAVEDIERALDQTKHTGELTHRLGDLLDVITNDQEELLGSPRVEPVLTRTVGLVREEFPAATVTVEGELPAVSVRANGLLDSVFHNVLRNAVQHNDTDDPTVTVSVRVDDDTVTVRIADDGPGVPDRLKDEIFGEGTAGVTSGGIGLGLYLVETVVDSYGGTVRVEDGEPRGAVFEIGLPRA